MILGLLSNLIKRVVSKMRISLNWLNDYVDIKNEDYNGVAEKITRAGVNVEGIETLNVDNLVVGYVEERSNHINADNLSVCKVNIGDETVQIVCGADNVDKGQKVIVAKVDAVLPGDFVIKEVSIRGIESKGMICALYELGLEDKDKTNHKGIHILPDEAVIGKNPLTYLGLDDTIYELDLNPNRNDCLSHIGFAYEVGAVLNKEVKLPPTETNDIEDNINNHFTLEVETEKCSFYKARMVKDLIIGESPNFIKKRLQAAGMRPINNVVDISNYIMLEYGQPVHFFDKNKIGDKIIVRMAEEGEKAITIDNKENKLIKEDIVITNNDNIIGIAGVMGCANSEVDDNTTSVLIESAIFDPFSVRYTSIRLDLRSDASIRFEKGLNYEWTEIAINRACYLLEKYASGKVLNGEVTYDKVDKTEKKATVSKAKIEAVLGYQLTDNNIMDSFDRLGFTFSKENDNYNVIIPNRRMDVSIKEDLIEEVGRLFGYDNIVGKMPIGPIKKGKYNDKTLFHKQVSNRMRQLGINEVKTYTLISETEDNLFKYNYKNRIKLQRPMSVDKNIIRQSLLPSLLNTVNYNTARGVKDVNIYEISNVYYVDNNKYEEITKLSFALVGDYISNSWQKKDIKVDFYLLKGIIENLLNYLGLDDRYVFKNNANLSVEIHPGISSEIIIDNISVGYIGFIHPTINKLPIYIGEINLDMLMDIKTKSLKYEKISKYPSVIKDIAFIVDKDLEAASIMDVIKKSAGKTLEKITVFDVYEGTNIDSDKKSVAFSLTFTDINKTLTDKEVNELLDNIMDKVNTNIGGIIRDK